MLKVGCHQSIAGGYRAMAQEAKELGATTLSYFSRNPRGGGVRALDLKDMQAFHFLGQEMGLFPIVAHAPYTYNLASDKTHVRSFALSSMKEDLQRMDHIPGNYYNFHPGSHVGQGVEKGIELIVSALNDLLKTDYQTIILLEAMAGKGSEIGRSFEELQSILQGLDHPQRVGVLLDTCHLYDAGYDIKEDLQDVLQDFDKTVGLNKLKAMHINDSKNPFASHKDRHEKLGLGSLGIETFKNIVKHSYLSTLPLILETPQDFEGYKQEIQLLGQLAFS
ncbi:MAG: deoxyribonuclease IV [Tissierellia bacterium]|nr:deoxyribonuclease IV [Tissierellia bacterium]